MTYRLATIIEVSDEALRVIDHASGSHMHIDLQNSLVEGPLSVNAEVRLDEADDLFEIVPTGTSTPIAVILGVAGEVVRYQVASTSDTIAVDLKSEACDLIGDVFPLSEVLVTRSDAGLCLVATGRSAVQCKVSGKFGRADLKLIEQGGADRSFVLPEAVHGLADARLRSHAIDDGLGFAVAAVDPGDPPKVAWGLWCLDSGETIEQWTTRQQDQIEAEQLARRLEAENATLLEATKQLRGDRANSPDLREKTFVNPYTFVPFPNFPEGADIRTRPAGHDRLRPGRFAGSFRVRITTRTPLIIRIDGAGRFPTRPDPDDPSTSRPFIPATSMKGAVRSLHETLAGGCLRVFDSEFVPFYREQAAANKHTTGWALARVEAVEHGRPSRFTVCTSTIWVRAEDIHTVVGSTSLRTGTLLNIDTSGRLRTRLGRQELDPERIPSAITEGEEWVVMVSDAGARKGDGEYWCAVGKLHGGQSIPGMTDTAWDTYRLAADGADDVRLQRRDQRMKGGGEKVNLDVWTRGGLHIGQRQIVSMEAKVGDIYWVRTTDPALDESDQSQDSADVSGDSYPHDATRVRLVAEMKAAFLWRGPGKGEAEKRVPAILLPCTNPDSLCISCRVFGMTGEQNDTKGAAEHRAYRGHVRIGDALAMGAVELLGVALAPLGAPRPGAGQMYLVHDGKPATTRDDLPTREWGAAPDDGGPRPLRGRKYYWHGDPNVQYPPRYRERRHQAGKAMGGEVQAAPPGSEFQAEVTFENLDAAEIGGLMAAFDPALVLKDSYVPPGLAASQVLHRIGGGKPLGLGTVEVKIEPQSFLAESAAARYLGEADHALPSVESCIDAFVVSVPGAVRQVWPDLAAVLDFGHVDPRFIWYPPGDTWSRAGTEPFDQGFEFWKENSGRFLANDPVDMVALPPPRDADQYLAIVPRRRPGRGKAKP